ncbi:MAG: hypothetical protein WC824_14230 [Bacteroidota bacterium]
MQHSNIKIRIEKGVLLAKLKENRSKHAEIVKEARVGYVEKAKAALAEKMSALSEGKIVALHFDLVLPQDYTKEYDTVIGMLGLTLDDVIELDTSEYRRLVEDQWDWRGQFIFANAAYSPTSAALMGQES